MKLSQLITHVKLRKKNVLQVFCILMFKYVNEALSY